MSSSTISGTSGCVQREIEWQKSTPTISCPRWRQNTGVDGLLLCRSGEFLLSLSHILWSELGTEHNRHAACMDLSTTFAEYLRQKLDMVPSCNVSDSLKVIETVQILHFEILDGC